MARIAWPMPHVAGLAINKCGKPFKTQISHQLTEPMQAVQLALPESGVYCLMLQPLHAYVSRSLQTHACVHSVLINFGALDTVLLHTCAVIEQRLPFD